MHRYIVPAAYGWLAVTGFLHFAVDVVAQYLRGVRAPGAEATLYYGLNSAFALGQVAFGAVGFLIASRASSFSDETALLILSGLAGLGWLAITVLFMGYWEPKISAGLYCLLVAAAFLTR